jgi:hypothetical protein
MEIRQQTSTACGILRGPRYSSFIGQINTFERIRSLGQKQEVYPDQELGG